jgi:hypothetical protein
VIGASRRPIQRKVIKPADLDAVAQPLTEFEPRHNATPTPYDRRFTRADPAERCRRIHAHRPAGTPRPGRLSCHT